MVEFLLTRFFKLNLSCHLSNEYGSWWVSNHIPPDWELHLPVRGSCMYSSVVSLDIVSIPIKSLMFLSELQLREISSDKLDPHNKFYLDL